MLWIIKSWQHWTLDPTELDNCHTNRPNFLPDERDKDSEEGQKGPLIWRRGFWKMHKSSQLLLAFAAALFMNLGCREEQPLNLGIPVTALQVELFFSSEHLPTFLLYICDLLFQNSKGEHHFSPPITNFCSWTKKWTYHQHDKKRNGPNWSSWKFKHNFWVGDKNQTRSRIHYLGNFNTL